MVEEFDLLEEVEVQFCDEECTESVWHGVKCSESLFCREKPKSELTVVIKEEGMMYLRPGRASGNYRLSACFWKRQCVINN